MIRVSLLVLILCVNGLITSSCRPGDIGYQERVPVTVSSGREYGDTVALTRETYRIDLQEIRLRIDYHPYDFRLEGEAELHFTLMIEEGKPIFHLEPVLEDGDNLLGLELDGLTLDLERDWRVVEMAGSRQRSIEIQRTLVRGDVHRLRIRYGKRLKRNYYMLNSQVSDLYGRSNEGFFPTLNRFGDLARHRIDFYVHGGMPFRFLGSGHIEPIAGETAAWRLDTERAVPSNTVMFVLVPQADTVEAVRTIEGVSVRVVAFSGEASVEEAFHILSQWLVELRQNLGPFPMSRGYQVFLMSRGGGMEYYGGTISSLAALTHETLHMYLGTSLLLSSYRDAWIDEALDEWYAQSALGSLSAIPEGYRSNMVSGRSPVGLGFDRRAYGEGAQIMEHVAQSLGGRWSMINFLAELVRDHSYQPFSTQDFLRFLRDYSGLDYSERFENWLYQGERVQAALDPETAFYVEQKHRVDPWPPPSILERYPELKKGEGK